MTITRSTLAVLASAVLLGACGDKANKSLDNTAPAASAPQGQGVPVSTVQASTKSLDVALQGNGTVAPVSSVDVKSQMTGVITQVHVKEGQTVKGGQLLFTLDTRADEANVSRLRAQIAKDEALLADAQRQLARARDLQSKSFISQGAVDTAQATVESQIANLNADKASLEAARVPLSYGRVTAASAGRIGLVPVFAGSVVQANITTLTTITQLDPIDVTFTLPQNQLQDLLAAQQSGKAKVRATLPDNNQPMTGKLHFVDSVVDAATGTVKAKARFDNASNLLWPGAFVKISLKTRTLDNAVVVPTQAIIQGPRGAIVYVVADGKAVVRPVKVLAAQGEDSAVTGVNDGDKVVVNGRQNLRPDVPVHERAPDTDKDSKKDAAGASPAKTSATDKAAS